MNPVLTGAKYVVDRSRHVRLNEQRLNEFCKSFNRSDAKHWLSASPVKFDEYSAHQRLNLLFVYSAMGFCYWGDPPWSVEYHGKTYAGSFGMMAALGKAIEGGYPITETKYRANMPREDLTRILKGNGGEIPLFEERLTFMRETGEVLLQKRFGRKMGGVIDLILEAEHSAPRMLRLLVDNFSAFQDPSTYEGMPIHFNKKAQLFISDLYQSNWGVLNYTSELTALADYRIPQVLRRLGILSYSKELAERIDGKVQIPRGSAEEVEIRANMVWAVQLMYEQLEWTGIRPIELNDHFWLLRRQLFPDDDVHHRTLTTAY